VAVDRRVVVSFFGSKTEKRRKSMSVKAIVCGITGSVNSQKAVKTAVETALSEAARLVFVYVVDVAFLNGLTIQLRPKYAEDFLERLGNELLDEAAEIASAGGVASKKVLRKGKVMVEIRTVLQEEKGDLLVVSDEGRGFAEKVLFGKRLPDNIKELERRAGVPVKVIR
jgi:nucleotide-binding universal stress UspA family protein